MRTAKLQLTVAYDEQITSPEALAFALDALLKTALLTDGILHHVGDPKVGQFSPVVEVPRPR